MAAPAVSAGAVRAVSCPSCGAAIELRGLAWTQSVACGHCGAVLDARDPNLRILQRAHERMTVEPLIPLGTRGEWRGAPYEVIGFQQRTISVDGDDYSWREYLLFNPYRGFRYLTEYDGHWNDVVPLLGIPLAYGTGARSSASYGGQSFRLFQTARARTTFIAGEFPWQVRAGDSEEVRDYVAPPRVLSAEGTQHETTWSLGSYVDGPAVWKAFALPGRPPQPLGIYANQPSPYAGGVGSWWRTFGLLALLCLVGLLGRALTARRARVYEGRYELAPPSTFARAVNADSTVTGTPLVTPRFTIPGATGNVVVETDADVSQEWMYLQYTLVDETTGQAWPFGREVAYYSGSDADGTWSEGRRRDRVTLGPVPGGQYVLRVEPIGQPRPGHPITYTLRVTRDVPRVWPFAVVLLALLVPPVVGTYRAASFETRRWAESDAGSKLASVIQDATDT
ncbi:protein of unknown function DUF4178 (plasmid) [Gemmatirosa kalamazoonensis]|uniref:DUF4178 domain-containing protein n=1 Tax=Gemmatirosa kalamazoonensis TaxID=861299 RepID=W0RU14_9BACT|nr:DUF4178 domain-containing protein [Gemmatirosa kalamazoonensis]AHG93083.1 protein of unknown function DUF4178 [Gemmatirosa kalamazoonensis]